VNHFRRGRGSEENCERRGEGEAQNARTGHLLQPGRELLGVLLMTLKDF
jgi:hypothetical protein